MGKATKRKHEALQARLPDFPNLFLKSKEVEAKKEAEIVSFNPMKIIEGYEKHFVRSLENFTPRTRSLNTSTRTKELVRYAFNKYNPPSFLYQVWEPDFKSEFNTFSKIKEDYKLWYIATAQGKSLYKEHTMGLLTKKETHFFSVCPYTLTIPEAIWYAVIHGMDEKVSSHLAKKIASTTISREPLTDFWKDIVRWFMFNQTSIKQMNDLLDYIRNRHAANAEWYIKDMTLGNLIKHMHSWHREMGRVGSMARMYPKWDGIKVQDSVIERGVGRKLIKWKFHQITTGKDLAVEGNKQHHCVSSYAAQCAIGRCSIWSLTQWDVFDAGLHALTIEVRDGVVVQARGYANRLPKANEMSTLQEWAAKSGFKVRV